MKKFLVLLLTLLVLTASACAETTAFVSITDETGALVLPFGVVTVTDTDEDGALTIADALHCAHVQYHENGADAFATYNSEYGLSMAKLWGVDNGGSYGYYLNNQSAWSLLDPIAEGDHVKAFVYTDLTAWSDTYCFFNADVVTVAPGEVLSLNLYAAGWDENYAPITLPVEGASITVNGVAIDSLTDAEGNAMMIFADAGVYIVSAQSDSMNLVAPVCLVSVE